MPWVRLGDWPTPVEPLPAVSAASGGEIWVKREDRSSARYGGNKVRTLEAIFGRAVAAGAERVWATGAYGSNHALATVLHAGTAGVASGAIVFPQPVSEPARANLAAMLSGRPEIVRISGVVALPFAMRRVRQQRGAYVMPPGGATPQGTFGALSAALELAEQVARGECPPPAIVVVAAGSTCTTAGLLVGFRLAAELGIGFTPQTVPLIRTVRVTPWPVTDATVIALLALRTTRALDALRGTSSGADLSRLRAGLDVDGRELRAGYGRVSARGVRAAALFARAGGPPLDIVYSAKAAASLLEIAPRTRGPILFWATKSSAPLPVATPAELATAPAALRRWLGPWPPPR